VQGYHVHTKPYDCQIEWKHVTVDVAVVQASPHLKLNESRNQEHIKGSWNGVDWTADMENCRVI